MIQGPTGLLLRQAKISLLSLLLAIKRLNLMQGQLGDARLHSLALRGMVSRFELRTLLVH